MSAPRFSVVIAAYNAQGTIASAVRSVLSQTAEDLEVIVVDDGSVDRTAAAVRAVEDPRVRLQSQPNRGQAAARNRGIASARGRYVAFLDSDDLLLPDYLERMGAALEVAQRPGFAYTDAYVFDPASGRVRRQTAMHGMRPPVPPPAGRERFLLELLARNFIYVSATVPRYVLEEVGGYDESLFAAEDYGLWLRILMRGHEAVWVPGEHALYRAHRDQMSQDRVRMSRHTLAMLRSLPSEAMPSDAHRELLARRVRDAERELAIVEGQLRVRSALRRLRGRLGRIRRRLGLAYSWYGRPPAEVQAAFPDLRAV